MESYEEVTLVWEVHVKHDKGGWSIRQIEAPFWEDIKIQALEEVFKFYSPEARKEGLSKSHVSRAIPFRDWDHLRQKQPLTNSGSLSYSSNEALNEVKSSKGGTRMATETTTKEKEKAEKAEKAEKVEKEKVEKAEAKLKEKEKADKAEAVRRANVVSVEDLSKKFSKEPRIIRRILRAAGFKAPRGEDTSNRYEWPKNDPELKKIEKAISEYGQKKEEKEEKKEEEKTPAKA